MLFDPSEYDVKPSDKNKGVDNMDNKNFFEVGKAGKGEASKVIRVFKFDHSEGAEIIAANNAKEAIMFYFTEYNDDSQTDDTCSYDGIAICELTGAALTKEHLIFDEEKNTRVKVTYGQLAEKYFKGKPEVLVMPNY